MKKKLFLKLFIFAVISTFVTFTSCKDKDLYDDDDDDDISNSYTNLVMNIKAFRCNNDSKIIFPGEENRFVLSNLFGENLDPVIGFMIEAMSGKSDLSTLRLSVRVLDHEDQVLWESPLRAMEGRNLVEIARKELQLPLDEYLLFEARAIDPQGQTLMTSQIPFGVLSQDGDLADLPVPNSVRSAQLDSPFGAIPSNLDIDQKLPGFTQKSLYTIRMSGANWTRGSSKWYQESKDSKIMDPSTSTRELFDKYNFNTVVMAGHQYPLWATTDGISEATGTNIADVDAFRAYVRWLCAREQERGVKYIQFFNEPQFQDSQKVQTHMKVLAAGAEEVRKSFPGMKIVTPGYNGGIVPAETYLKAGAGELVDVIDIHNYATSLEQMEEWMVEQSKLLEKYAPGRELWSEEIAPRWTISIGDMEMADRLIKIYVIGMRHGFKKLFWFGWRPIAYDEWEASMVDEDDQVTPRPVWFAYRTMTRKLEGRKFVAEIPAGTWDRAFLFEGDQGPAIVAWRDNTNKEYIKLPILVDGKSYFTATDYLGKVYQDSVITSHPVFLE